MGSQGGGVVLEGEAPEELERGVECLLIFKDGKFTLERLQARVHSLKHIRDAVRTIQQRGS